MQCPRENLFDKLGAGNSSSVHDLFSKQVGVHSTRIFECVSPSKGICTATRAIPSRAARPDLTSFLSYRLQCTVGSCAVSPKAIETS